jgi:hypothetical protein
MAGFPIEALVRTLTDLLARAVEQSPSLASDPKALAQQIAPDLARAIGVGNLGALVAADTVDGDRSATPEGSPRDRVLGAVSRHPAGRSPGLPPDALSSLTGLSLNALGVAVSALVQAGDLIREAWLVRLPDTGDLLPHSRVSTEAPTEPVRTDAERRAIGDRRRLGERRLYERRH